MNKLNESIKPLDIISTVNTIVDNLGGSFAISNTSELVSSEGVCTWTVTHNLNTSNIICSLYKEGIEITRSIIIDSDNQITVSFYSSINVAIGECSITN